MVSGNAQRLSKLAKEFNVGIQTIVEFLHKKGFPVDSNPNTKVSEEACLLLEKEYKSDVSIKRESELITLRQQRLKKEVFTLDDIARKDEPEDEFPEDHLELKDLKKSSQVAAKPKEKEVVAEKPEEITRESHIKPFKVIDTVDISTLPGVRKKPAGKTAQPTGTGVSRKKEEPAPVVEPAAVSSPPPEPSPAESEIPKTPEEMSPAVPQKTVTVAEHIPTDIPKVEELKVVGKIDLDQINSRTRPDKKTKEEKARERKERTDKVRGSRQKEPVAPEPPVDIVPGVPDDVIVAKAEKLAGPTIVGKIDLPVDKKPVGADGDRDRRKKRRKRIQKDTEKVSLTDKPQGDQKKGEEARKPGKKKKLLKREINEEDVQKQIKDTLARLTTKGSKSKGSKYRREKRAMFSEKVAAEAELKVQQKNILKITEFVTVNELATMMDVPVTKIISTCMSLGLFVSINQRLDAETLSVVADEFGYQVEFVSVEIQEAIEETADQEEDLKPRPPIVTVMGHVDHGKTSLLDYIRSANVIAGEAGGITQHIGAYNVRLPDGRKITFLDTPGHEAFTAMRARGAQVTDIAIIIVAADDNVMPQTIEAINHASAALVPIVFAINKIDKPGANPEKIKESLANMNYLIEEWGGKYQSHDISAKKGTGIMELLEKVLLEAEMLDLKANPDKKASGTIIESSLDRGRGFVATILVQSGTLKVGDVVLAGQNFGHIKAMFNERNQKIEKASPAEPVLILGLDGAPQAGDKFHVMESERDARQIANKREQLAREQGLRTQKHITLDEIGRRIAIGNFQELNLIVKGDVDGSVEALSDSLIKLSTEEIQVNIIHKAVGQISESDIMLASASEAVVVGFQVRPSLNARKLAEKEQIDIRLYSIIYDAINEIKAAMQGMLSPEIKEEITGTIEVLETFKITKVGTVAGCIVRDGKIARNNKIRVIREGIVIYTGNLGSLKRFKEDVKEVKNGYECGLNIDNFNDIKVGDNIEAFIEVEVAKQL